MSKHKIWIGKICVGVINTVAMVLVLRYCTFHSNVIGALFTLMMGFVIGFLFGDGVTDMTECIADTTTGCPAVTLSDIVAFSGLIDCIKDDDPNTTVADIQRNVDWIVNGIRRG